MKRWLQYQQAINYFVHEFVRELHMANAQGVFTFGPLEAGRAIRYCRKHDFDPELIAAEAWASFRGRRGEWRRDRDLAPFEIPEPGLPDPAIVGPHIQHV